MFAQPGMGKMIYDAILGNDFNLALTGLLFATLVTLLSNLLADLAYGWLDPRIVLNERDRTNRACAPLAAVSPWRLRWRRFRQHRAGMGSLVVLALAGGVLPAAVDPLAQFCGIDPYATDLLSRYDPPSAAALAGHRRRGARRTGAADARRADFAAGRRAGDGGGQPHRADRRRGLRLFRQARGCAADAVHRRR